MTLTWIDVIVVAMVSSMATMTMMFIWRVIAAAAAYRREMRVRQNVLIGIHESMKTSQEFNNIIKNIDFGDD